MLGSVDDDELWRRLHGADVLCAPSLGGESFGMVLIEAFAAGTPGRRLRHRRLPPGRDATAATGCWCRPATRSSWPRRCARCGSTRLAGGEMGAAARARAADFAWPRVAAAGHRRLRARASRRRRRPAGRRAMRVKAGLGRPICRRAAARAGCPRWSRGRCCRALAVRGCSPARGGSRSPSRRSSGVLLAFLALRHVGVDNVVLDAGATRARAGCWSRSRSSPPRWSCARSRGTRSCGPRCPSRRIKTAHDPERHRRSGC